MNIFITEPEQYSEKALALYRLLGEVKLAPQFKLRSELLLQLKDCEILVIRLGLVIDKELIDAAPNLKIIASPTTGLNHIDVEYAKSKNIKVVSLKGETEFLRTVHATAEHTMALMLALTRKLPSSFESVKSGIWNRDLYKGTELAGKTLGIVGFGRLGSKVAKYAEIFGMRVIAYDPYVSDEIVTRANVEPVSFEALLVASDVVSVHVSLSDETRGMIGAYECGLMKKGAMLINTSRGEIIDEKALLNALQSEQLAGAALDVLTDELQWGESKKISGNGTSEALIEYARTHDNCIITPHIGGATKESMEKTEIFIAERITRCIGELF